MTAPWSVFWGIVCVELGLRLLSAILLSVNKSKPFQFQWAQQRKDSCFVDACEDGSEPATVMYVLRNMRGRSNFELKLQLMIHDTELYFCTPVAWDGLCAARFACLAPLSMRRTMSDLNRVRVWPICCQCTLSALRASGQSIFGTARLYDCTTVLQYYSTRATAVLLAQSVAHGPSRASAKPAFSRFFWSIWVAVSAVESHPI